MRFGGKSSLDIGLVMRCQSFREESDDVVMMLWERAAIELESILKLRREQGIIMDDRRNVCAMRDESGGVSFQQEKRISAVKKHQMSVKGKRINLQRE